MTLFLKFTDEDEAINALSDYISDEGEWITDSHTHSLSVIGTIHKPTGNMIKGEDGSYPEMAPIPGFHVNFIGTLPETLTPYLVTPVNPTRVFAV